MLECDATVYLQVERHLDRAEAAQISVTNGIIPAES